MPGNKARSKYRKKRKGFQNRKIPRHGPSGIIIENSPSPLISPSVTSDLNNTIQPQPVECREKLSTPKTVSKRKLESHDMFSSEKKRASVAALPKSVDSKSADSNMPGYRIINMGQFGEALNTFHACDEGRNIMFKLSLPVYTYIYIYISRHLSLVASLSGYC